MDIPIKEMRLTLAVLARDLTANTWERLYNRATIPDTAIRHTEDIKDRLCKELEILWRQSKTRWFGRYAFSLANVRFDIDSAKVYPDGRWEPQALYMDKDFPLDGTVPLEDMGEHIVACFRDIFPKFLHEAGRKVYVK